MNLRSAESKVMTRNSIKGIESENKEASSNIFEEFDKMLRKSIIK